MSALPSRRDVLRAAGVGALSLATGAAAGPPIVDTHIHLYDPRRPQGVPWPPKTDSLLYRPMLPAAYAAMVRPQGVTGAIVVEASQWIEDNQWVLDLARDHSIILGLVGHLEPGEDFRTNLTRFAKNSLFRGIRLNGNAIAAGVERPAFIADLRRLAMAGLMLDAIGNAAMVTALLRLTDEVPELRVAVDHMPVEPPGWRGVRAEMRELAKRPQVYAKVSGVLQRVDGKVPEDVASYREALDEVWQMFGEDRVMYGSNWPVSDRLAPYRVVLQVVREYAASRGDAASGKFFEGNARKCYRWVDRG